MTSPHAPTPEAITPQGDRNSPHLTAVAERLAEDFNTNTGLEEPHPGPEQILELEVPQQQPPQPPSRDPDSDVVKEEKQLVEDGPEHARSDGETERLAEGNSKVATGDQSGPDGLTESKLESNNEIKGEPEGRGTTPPTMPLTLLESVEGSNHKTNDIPLKSAEASMEDTSNEPLVAEGRTAAELVSTMADRGTVQDDAAVATMPPRADQIPESMGLFPGAIDNAAFMAYMQTPANFYGMGVNGIDVNGPLSLSQTSGDGLLALQMASTLNMNPFPFDEPTLDPSPNIGGLDTIVEDHHRVSAYAKLEFQDGEFYMNTYQVYLGRDQAMMKAAIRREKEEETRQLQEQTRPHTPVRPKTGSKYSKSAVSEIGGILRDVGDSDHEEKVRKRKLKKPSKKSKSTGSSSRHVSRRSSFIQQDELAIPQHVKQESPKATTAVPVDPASLRPSPHDCPIVAIHPPGGLSKDFKSISRMHVLIKYNQKKHLFEAEILGRNGAFIDDVFYVHTDIIELKSGSQLQLGGVVVRFVLPDVAVGQTGAEHRPEYEESILTDRYSEGGKEMSFDFEDTPRRRKRAEPSESVSDGAELEFEEDLENNDNEVKDIREYAEDDEDEDGNEEDFDDDDDNHNSDQSDSRELDPENDEIDDDKQQTSSVDHKVKSDKKRGPGRPPKNGIMSKREQKLAKKQALEAEKAKQSVEAVGETQSSTTGKKKVGRPRIHPRTDSPPGEKREKRKYTKRKPKEPKDPNVKGENSGEDKPAKPKKEKKPKPERSPTPTFNEAELTAEQLAKPQANYVTLIYDALMDSKTGQMSLPQLYRAIQRKYPYFVLKTSTSGWQSSVRHNLSQHAAFQKTERDGKGWMWAIVQGASIEKEKKRRTTPPQQHYPGPHQQIYQAGQPHAHYAHYPPNGMMGQPPPGYYPPPHQMGPNGYPGQPPYMPPQHMNGIPYNGPHMNGHSHPPPYIPPNMLAPLAGNSGSSYSSPYAPKPATAAPLQQNGPLPQPPILPHPPSQALPQPEGIEPPPQHSVTSQDPGQQNSTPLNHPQALVTHLGSPSSAQPSTSQTQSPQTQIHQSSSQLQLNHSHLSVASQPQPCNQPADNSNRPHQHIQNVAQKQPQAPQASQAPQPPQTHQASQTSQARIIAQASQAPQQSSQESNGYGPANRDNDDPLVAFIERFKPLMVDSLKGKSENPTEVVESAANRLLGKITVSAVPGDPFEAKIFEIMKKALRSIPAFKYGVLPGSPSDQDDPRQPQSPGHQNGVQDNSFQQSFQHTGTEVPSPAVARPAFTGQGRSRPSGTLNPISASAGSFQRPDSGGEAYAFPAIAANTTGQTELNNPSHGPPSMVGTTRNQSAALSSSMGVAISTTAPGNLLVPSPHTTSPGGTQKPNIEGLVTPQPCAPANGQLFGQKRPHSDTDEGQEREVKRLATGNQFPAQKVETIHLSGIPEFKETTNPHVTPSPPVTTA